MKLAPSPHPLMFPLRKTHVVWCHSAGVDHLPREEQSEDSQDRHWVEKLTPPPKPTGDSHRKEALGNSVTYPALSLVIALQSSSETDDSSSEVSAVQKQTLL